MGNGMGVDMGMGNSVVGGVEDDIERE